MSRMRQDDEPSVRGYAVTHPPGSVHLPVETGWDQLLYTAAGTMNVRTAAGTWVVPPYRALWLPDGAVAEVGNRNRVAVRGLYLAGALRVLAPEVQTYRLRGFVRELLLHVVRACPLDADDRVGGALITVLLDQLRGLPTDPLQLPSPTGVAARAAELIRSGPERPLDRVADDVGVSRRTLERAFRAGTGLGLGAWRRRSRILASLDLLASGATVTEAAMAAGYSAPSAYVTAFRAELGAAPREFLRP